MKTLIEVIGWIGAVEVIVAYFLISANKISGKDISYQILNLTGGILLIINTIYLHAYPSAFVNLIWVGIASFSIFQIYKPKTNSLKAKKI